MHAITSAYTIKDCNLNDYYWLREATATWAEHYVFPDVDSERPFVPIFMGTPEQPLESLTPSDHEYSAYLFLFYLYHNYTPQYVPAIWQQGEQISGSLAAINSALKSQSGGQGFTHFWPEFVRRNWNQPPFNQYERWDPGRSPLTDGAVTYGTLTNINGHPIDQNHIESVKLDGGGDFEYELRAQVSHLAAHYFHFEFPAFDDQSDKNVRSVGFTDFGLVKDNPQAHIQALIKYEGKDWEVEDWSKKSTEYGMLIGLCRDTKKERVEELVIIISNTDWEKKEQLKLTSGRLPRLIANNIGCSKWGGEILNIVRSPYPGPGLVTNVVRTEITVTASERQPPFYLPGRLEGKGEGRWSSWMDGCEGLGDGLHHSASNLLLNSLNAAADAMERRFYTWNLADYPPIPGPTNTLIFTCPGDPPKKAYTQPVWMHSPLGAPTHGTGFVKSDGTIGDKSSDQLPADIETRWVFSPLPE
jgi:hypothetical protein